MDKPKRKERVEIKCPVRTDGAIKNKELPWKLLVMAPLSGQPNPILKRPQLVSTNSPNDIASLMKKVKPVLRIDVTNKLRSSSEPTGGSPQDVEVVPLTLEFESMEGFTKEGLESALSKLMPEFKEKLSSLRKYQNLRTGIDMNEGLQDLDRELADPDLLEVLARLKPAT